MSPKHPAQPPLPTGGVHLAWAARPAQAPAHAETHEAPLTTAPSGALLRPLPQLPAADKVALSTESRMRLAVALDVICSATRKIAPGPAVLVQATRAWLGLRGRQHSSEVLEELVQQARGPQAVARARISRALTRAARGGDAQSPVAEQHPGASEALTTPQSVVRANRDIEAAGQLIVAEMVLWLDSRERVDYRRG